MRLAIPFSRPRLAQMVLRIVIEEHLVVTGQEWPPTEAASNGAISFSRSHWARIARLTDASEVPEVEAYALSIPVVYRAIEDGTGLHVLGESIHQLWL